MSEPMPLTRLGDAGAADAPGGDRRCRYVLLVILTVATVAIKQSARPAALRDRPGACARLAAAWIAVDVHAAPGLAGAARGRWPVFFVVLVVIMAAPGDRGRRGSASSPSPATSTRSRSCAGRGGWPAWPRSPWWPATAQAAGMQPGHRPGPGGADLRRAWSRSTCCRVPAADLVRRVTATSRRTGASRPLAELSEANRRARGDAGRERGPARAAARPRPGRPGSSTSGSGWPGRSTTPWPRG